MPFLTQGKTNWKYILIVVILAVIIGGGTLYCYTKYSGVEFPPIEFPPKSECEQLYGEIEEEFKQANFCEQDLDCKAIMLGGPYVEFGCFKYVNKKIDENKLLKRVEEYDKRCRSAIDKCALAPDAVCVANKCLSKKEIISQQIIDKCEEEAGFIEQIQSDPDCLKGEEFRCVDGWGVIWHYDKNLVSITEFPSTFPSDAPKELKEATVAKRGSSVCACKEPISYEVLVEDKFEKTTCEKFYKFIEDYNSSCNNCLQTWSFECC